MKNASLASDWLAVNKDGHSLTVQDRPCIGTVRTDSTPFVSILFQNLGNRCDVQLRDNR